MNHQDRRSKSILGRIRPWMWISFAGALAPLVLWAALSALNGGDLMSSPVGKTLTLNKTGVAVSKTTLENLLTSSKVSIALLVGTGQLLNPAVGTRVKVTYSELFRDTTIYQVLIQSGKYKGRTGWVMEQQTDWNSPARGKIKLDANSNYELPSGLGDDALPSGLDLGDIPPDSGK